MLHLDKNNDMTKLEDQDIQNSAASGSGESNTSSRGAHRSNRFEKRQDNEADEPEAVADLIGEIQLGARKLAFKRLCVISPTMPDLLTSIPFPSSRHL